MLRQLLEEREDTMVELWLDRVLAAYPAEGGALLRRPTDRFANPIGHSVRQGTRALFRSLAAGDPITPALAAPLSEMLRIRAVQQIAPSTAVGFVLELKSIVRARLAADGGTDVDPGELRAFEDRVDHLALVAFDVYVSLREELAQLRVSEMRRHVGWIVDRLNGVAASTDSASEPGQVPVQIQGSRARTHARMEDSR